MYNDLSYSADGGGQRQLPSAVSQGATTQPYAQQQPNDTSQQAQQPSAQASNPMQPFYMQNPPMAQATMLDPSLMQALSPNATIQAILQGFAPQAASASRNLNDTLAAAGIAGGPAAGLQEQLQSQLASGLAPSIANAIMGSQGNILNASLANQSAANSMTGLNTGDIMQQLMANTGYANQSQDQIAQALMNAYGMNFNAFNNLNDAGLQGVQSLSATNMGSAGNMANTMANNFPVYQSMWPEMFQAAGAYFGAGG